MLEIVFLMYYSLRLRVQDFTKKLNKAHSFMFINKCIVYRMYLYFIIKV